MRYYTQVSGALTVAALLTVIALVLGMFGVRERFVSSEVHFTDLSVRGLQILPASCSSNPSYYHNALAPYGGVDFISYSGQSEYGAYKNGVYICVTNNTGTNYFVPGGTAAEMNAFKAAAGPIPNLDAW